MHSVTAPLASSTQVKVGRPLESIRVRHSEYVKDIETLNIPTFEAENVQINPGLSETFPWLSVISRAFEKYKWNSLKFHFIPALATTSPGSIALAPDYDAADVNLGLPKRDLLSFSDSVSGPIWSGLEMRAKVSSMQNDLYYVRDGALAANLDIKTYDAMQLMILKTSSATHTFAGELWVSYDVTLYTPQISEPDPAAAEMIATTGVAYNVPFGTNGLANVAGTNPGVHVTPGKADGSYKGTHFSLAQAGRYLLNMAAQGTGMQVTPSEFIGPTQEASTVRLGDSVQFEVNGFNNTGTASSVISVLDVGPEHTPEDPFTLHVPGLTAAPTTMTALHTLISKIPSTMDLI